MRRISAAPAFVCSCAIALLLALLLPGAARAGTALELGIDGLVERADLVLEGRVSATRVLRTPQGRIETELTLQVARTFAGEPLSSRIVRIPGGVLPDGRGLLLAGLPRFAADEDVLVFLSSESPLGLRLPVGLAQGKLRIERAQNGGAKSLVRDESGTELVDARGASAGPAAPARLDYVRTIAAIEIAVAQKRARTSGAKR